VNNLAVLAIGFLAEMDLVADMNCLEVLQISSRLIRSSHTPGARENDPERPTICMIKSNALKFQPQLKIAMIAAVWMFLL